MSSHPLVTVITPTYNQDQYILETAYSVLSQTYPNIEYIIINDGSTDTTEQVLKKLPKEVVIINQPNVGQSATLNRGWSMAKGKYLAYLSSDDLYAPNLIKRMVDVLENDADTVCAFPNCDQIDENGKVLKRAVCKPFSFAELLIKQECFIGPGAVFRASAFEEEGGWRSDLRLCPDREFWLRLGRRGRIEFVSDVLAFYRTHGGSISYGDVSADAALEFLRITEECYANEASLPAEVQGRSREAQGYGLFIAAKFALRRGDIRAAIDYYHKARNLNPHLRSFRTLLILIKTTLSKPIRRVITLSRRFLRI